MISKPRGPLTSPRINPVQRRRKWPRSIPHGIEPAALQSTLDQADGVSVFRHEHFPPLGVSSTREDIVRQNVC